MPAVPRATAFKGLSVIPQQNLLKEKKWEKACNDWIGMWDITSHSFAPSQQACSVLRLWLKGGIMGLAGAENALVCVIKMSPDGLYENQKL